MKVHTDAELEPKAPIWGTVGSLWLVTLLLSAYGATSVADELGSWERLYAQSIAPPLVRALELGQKMLGLDHLHAALEAGRHRINDTYAVARQEDEVDAPADPTPPVEPEEPSPDRPAHQRGPSKHRVLVIGASSIQFALGVELERAFPRYEKVKVKRFGQLATSLARPDFFNWQEKAKSLIEEFKPDLIVTNFGGNDAQDILQPDGTKVSYDGPEWEPAFEGLVTDLIELGKKNGAETVMIGMPVMRDDKFTKKMRRLNAAMKKATEAAGALYVSTWELSANAKGEYLTQGSFEGKRGLLRTSDGVHYSKLGARIVVEATLELIERRFHLVPKDERLGSAEPHALESKQLGRWLPYVVYRPREAGDAPKIERPLIVVALAEEPSDAWPGSHPHRRLQALAESESVNLVLISPPAELDDAEAAGAFLASELRPDLEAHFPFGTQLGLIGAPGALFEVASQLDPPVRVRPLEGPWKKGLEPAVKALSAELRSPPPTGP